MRPDVLLLRVFCKSLVLMNETEPSERWIQEQIPDVLRAVYGRLRSRAVAADNAMSALSALDSPAAAQAEVRAVIAAGFRWCCFRFSQSRDIPQRARCL